jgi:hypothetical protein
MSANQTATDHAPKGSAARFVVGSVLALAGLAAALFAIAVSAVTALAMTRAGAELYEELDDRLEAVENGCRALQGLDRIHQPAGAPEPGHPARRTR